MNNKPLRVEGMAALIQTTDELKRRYFTDPDWQLVRAAMNGGPPVPARLARQLQLFSAAMKATADQ